MKEERLMDMHADKRLSSLLKKAKRRTLLRNTAVSLVISVLVLGSGFFANAQLLNKSVDHAMRDLTLFKQITGPNEYENGYYQSFGFLKGTLDYQTYKIVEGVPVTWNRKSFEYSVWGGFSRFPGNYSSIQLPIPARETHPFPYQRGFNPQNGQREMLFYLPAVDYGKYYLNELAALNEMNKDKLVELGISFDRNYTVEQIRAMLPAGVHPVWYWVDTYYDLDRYKPQKEIGDQKMPDGSVQPVEYMTDPEVEQAESAYGFGISPEGGEAKEDDFLSRIREGIEVKGKYYGEYKKIYDYLRGAKDQPSAADVKVLGVVVTGTADSLKPLQGKSFVKGATLGAIVDKY